MACGVVGDSNWCALVALRYSVECGLSRAAASQVALAVAELVTNVTRHGGGQGTVVLRALEQPRRGVEVVVKDTGPGIAVPELALQDGWSRGAFRTPEAPLDGLGTGLGTVRRVMDELSIESPTGGGTTVIARKWRSSRRPR